MIKNVNSQTCSTAERIFKEAARTYLNKMDRNENDWCEYDEEEVWYNHHIALLKENKEDEEDDDQSD